MDDDAADAAEDDPVRRKSSFGPNSLFSPGMIHFSSTPRINLFAFVVVIKVIFEEQMVNGQKHFLLFFSL